MTKKWMSPKPVRCDLCGDEFKSGNDFIDGKTEYGPWGIMCEACHIVHGYGLGIGRGQKYDWDTLEKIA